MSMNAPPDPAYFDGGDGPGRSDDGITVSSEVMVASVAFFFVVVVLVFFLHIYAKWRWCPVTAAHRAAAQSRRLVFGPDHDLFPRRGLDPAVLNSLPVHVFLAKESEDGIECAVCLSEVADGEKARLLPKCNHGFHLECIDMWFASHSTCPLCRNPIRLQQQEPDPEAAEAAPPIGSSPETTNLPANVLFYGNQDLVSTGGVTAGVGSQQSASVPESSVIDIPPCVLDGIPAADGKLPAAAETATTPLTAKLRSFKRMLSREKRVAGGSACGCCSSGDDVEQGHSGEAIKEREV